MPSSFDRLIDLNADVGEGPGEDPLYAHITSANIACGGHAGDESTMREAVRLALRHGVAIGAHPSYPDRESFGRVTLNLSPSELSLSIAAQVDALLRAAEAEGARVTHVKPHGALHRDAGAARDIALSIAAGVASVSPTLVLVGLAGSPALRVWTERGFRVAAEGFADRAYSGDGTLVPSAARQQRVRDRTRREMAPRLQAGVQPRSSRVRLFLRDEERLLRLLPALGQQRRARQNSSQKTIGEFVRRRVIRRVRTIPRSLRCSHYWSPNARICR